ncbi:MAG: UDP-N-acetylglucosamine pyrophosphorylase [Desulfatiglandales bacterium]
MRKGVDIPNPLTLDIGDEVMVEHISGHGVRIYPGCRIYGQKTLISNGAQIGAEGPATIDNCQIGPEVRLKGGFFRESVFLEGSSMGAGAHVREACLLEEQANGAHCVGLKQTILFPFVTLGSLINFCDCLMAGGTGRRDHSEVGSAYIHFNFTPEGDKTTASLIGDVPRGVMLNQPPIFLGGQGGMVGPLRLNYGNVVSAGSILRRDVMQDNKMIIPRTHRSAVIDFTPGAYRGLGRIVTNNLLYLANLLALKAWYLHVRRSFFESCEFGSFLYQGVLEKLGMAVDERLKRLEAMASKLSASETGSKKREGLIGLRREFTERVQDICEIFHSDMPSETDSDVRNQFLEALDQYRTGHKAGYIETMTSLPAAVSGLGTKWLTGLVNSLMGSASSVLPSFQFSKG